MQREIIERKCDVCGKTVSRAKRLGNLVFHGWYALQKTKAGGLESVDVCCKECLLKFAIAANPQVFVGTKPETSNDQD